MHGQQIIDSISTTSVIGNCTRVHAGDKWYQSAVRTCPVRQPSTAAVESLCGEWAGGSTLDTGSAEQSKRNRSRCLARLCHEAVNAMGGMRVVDNECEHSRDCLSAMEKS